MKKMIKEFNLNGKFLSRKDFPLFFNQGFRYGYGLFETMRAYHGKIFCLFDHLQRLKDSAEKINLPFPFKIETLTKEIEETIESGRFQEATVRLILSPISSKIDFLIWTEKFKPLPKKYYQKGVSACLSSFRRKENSLLSNIKSLNYLENILAFEEAKKKGFQEALFLNTNPVPYVVEGSRSNIFLVKKGRLITPSLKSGALPGITRKVVLELAEILKIKVEERTVKLNELYNADEAFLTNSSWEVLPLVRFEKRLIGNGLVGSLTKRVGFLYKRTVIAEISSV